MRRPRGFTLIELMIVVAIIGILASVAIPSFVKYMRRAKTVEALMNLRKMYDGAVAYYIGEHTDPNGTILPRKFSSTAPLTPAVIPKSNPAAPSPALWSTPEWNALNFAVEDPHRFSYAFIENGASGNSAFAQMIAQGDLDGDGIPSLFQRSCAGTTNGVTGGSGVVTSNELE